MASTHVTITCYSIKYDSYDNMQFFTYTSDSQCLSHPISPFLFQLSPLAHLMTHTISDPIVVPE